MIESRVISPETLLSNDAVVTFNVDTLRSKKASCCGWLQHCEGSPLYKIIEGGVYEVDLNAVVTTLTAAGIVALGIYVDGVLTNYGAVSLGATGGLGTISLDKKVKVCCKANSTITIQAVPSVLAGATLVPTATQVPTITNATFSIVKKA